ncbi:hypothetical protein V5P93_004482 [Actinokineospora auranticolor]|uniref:indole-3-glycerol-phosphate synthase n=1 Tax=Actinokineospora auranticolor TaxID=155976 RepID=A0A2S6GT71_9PSEU|nr:indole-3-glycerol phosphate synthase [Actinokineospora auranticolor]PPK68410.1 indole-3-glycerol phosphate synthase [Actinokineospora auranticolor]
MSGFVAALLGARVPVIAEVKPTDGRGAALLGARSPVELAGAYEAAGAPCLSVVTGRWFGGSPRLLADVAGRSGLPVLRKDFLTRDRDLVATRELGASAVLLTAGLLPRSVLGSLVDKALGLGLTPFVEVTSEAEIAAVRHPADCVIAVNNKDIRGREQGVPDLARSERLLPAVVATGCPCPVSASGISRPEDAARLLGAGFAGVLVGTALLRAPNLATWLAEVPR